MNNLEVLQGRPVLTMDLWTNDTLSKSLTTNDTISCRSFQTTTCSYGSTAYTFSTVVEIKRHHPFRDSIPTRGTRVDTQRSTPEKWKPILTAEAILTTRRRFVFALWL
ncbi:hypothetical protein TorRG33x02_050400 [Trema orientale]|uniref:Uncharacterized protein n=1 Tax=Trema orientale TaxID=63057 RepID=A0A2P5FN43_TREOI|nr:hypothetical protein TorRG33x02_050400 [Trema orientale]